MVIIRTIDNAPYAKKIHKPSKTAIEAAKKWNEHLSKPNLALFQTYFNQILGDNIQLSEAFDLYKRTFGMECYLERPLSGKYKCF